MLKKWILSGLVASSFLLPFSASAVVEISDGSVKALYHLEDAVDASGNGYNLSNYQSVAFSAGKLGNGSDYTATFNNRGSGLYQNFKQLVTRGFNLSASSNWTISTWFKPEDVLTSSSYDDGDNIFSLGKNSNKNEFLVTYTASKIGINMLAVGVANSDASASYTFSNGTWYLMTAIKNGNALSLYINGSFVVAATDGVIDGSACGADCAIDGLLIGGIGINNADNYSTRHADTMFDEFLVTTSAISSTTLASLYNAGAGNEVCTAVGCGAGSSTPAFESSSTPPLDFGSPGLKLFPLVGVVLLLGGNVYLILKK